MQLDHIGWTPDLQRQLSELDLDGVVPARVVGQERTGYALAAEGAPRVPGRLARPLRDAQRADPASAPAVGDWVAARPAESGGPWTVVALLPRRGAFSRKRAGDETAEQVVAANVDVLFVVQGLDGDLNPRRLERYLALAAESGARPVVVLNKADVCDDLATRVAEVERVAGGAEVIVASASEGTGVEALRARVPRGATAAFVGSSGVGKSSLVNRLLGEARFATQAVREDDSRGRHTTTSRHLVPVPGGGAIVDTPGMRELGLWGSGEGVASVFADLEALAASCRFRDCRHETEPACALRAALASGDLDAERLASWRKLQREVAFVEKRKSANARVILRAEARKWGRMHANVSDMKRQRREWEE